MHQELCWQEPDDLHRQESQEPPDPEVVVLGTTSPLETGCLSGRGHGVLASDRSVAVTFLLGTQDFMALRNRMLSGEREISIAVRAVDVTSIDIGGLGPCIPPGT